jgi:DNA-binding MarR family transcriptional regulator
MTDSSARPISWRAQPAGPRGAREVVPPGDARAPDTMAEPSGEPRGVECSSFAPGQGSDFQLGKTRALVQGVVPPEDNRHPANDAWEALLAAHATLMRRFGAQDVWEDLSMREYDVLYTLSKCPDPIRLTELNRHVLLSQPALSRMVDRLADRGLVSRTTDPSDGRGVRLALTEDGRAVQRRIGRRHGRLVAQSMLAGLTPAELRQLEELCAKLTAAPTRSE